MNYMALNRLLPTYTLYESGSAALCRLAMPVDSPVSYHISITTASRRRTLLFTAAGLAVTISDTDSDRDRESVAVNDTSSQNFARTN